ncbi:hypothetical protein HNY73_011228 [Argiope bruennichi]|uniref:Uncharacterized protein n=1 Tax=Argiope bruennichi TaxID=94029 RepID=A0A8T0F3F4_ARGBR|nr:hypothetical protein HNY73_011228 [Argiope bruennichi]
MIHFAKSFENTSRLNFNSRWKIYLDLRKSVQETDSDLCLLMFLSSLYFACNTYFGISLLIHYAAYIHFVNILPIVSACLLFSVGSFSFILMAGTGSLINEASSGICDKVNDVINSEQNPTPIQQRLLYATEKEMTMTVWKMTSIKRGFIFATEGTILTYSILLDNLTSIEHCSC